MSVRYLLTEDIAAQLVDPETGAVVFPISSAEFELWRAAAELHGLDLVATAGARPTGGSTVERPGLVVGLGRSGAAVAPLYAHLTGRKYVLAADAEALEAVHDVAVLLSERRLFDDQVAKLLYARDDRQAAPGLLLGGDVAELTLLAKRVALSLSAAPADGLRRVLVHTSAPFTRLEHPGAVVLGGGADNEEVLRAVSGQASVLAIHTKADIGANAWLTADSLLCPNDLEGEARAVAGPVCLTTGRCYRLAGSPTRVEAWREGRLVSAGRLSASVMVIHGCAILRPDDGVLSPAFTVGAAVIAKATFGAFIAPYSDTVSAADGGTLNQILNDAADGFSVGEVVQRFNRGQVGRRFGTVLCLVGDPAFRMAPDPAGFRFPDTAGVADGARPVSATAWRTAADAFIAEVVAQRRFAARSRAAAAASHVQTRLEAATTRVGETSYLEDLGQAWGELRDGLVRLLGENLNLGDFGSACYDHGPATEQGRCPHCDTPVRRFVLRHDRESRLDRDHLSCTACGAMWNRPVGSALQVTYAGDNRFSIEGHDDEVAVQVTFEQRDKVTTTRARYVVEADLTSFCVAPGLTALAGPLLCHIHVVGHAEIAYFVYRCRGDRGALAMATAGPSAARQASARQLQDA